MVGATPNVIVPPPDHANTRYWGAFPRTHALLVEVRGPDGPMTPCPPIHRQPHIGNCRAWSPAFVSRPEIDSFHSAGLTFFFRGFNFLQHKGSFTAKISGLQLLLRRPWSPLAD